MQLREKTKFACIFFLQRNGGDQNARRLERRRPRSSGIVLVMYLSAMTLLLAFCSLAVDFGHIVVTKTEVRTVADAAAHAAAQQLINSGSAIQQIAAARAAAEQIALLNFVDGQLVTLLDNDIQVGNWDTTKTPNFSTTRTPYNAAQVSLHHDASRANPVTLLFASVIGFSSMDVVSTCTAVNSNLMSPYGFVGLDSVTFGSIGVLATVHGDVVSNGTISIGQPLGIGVSVTGDVRSTGGSVGHGVFAAIAGSTAPLTTSLIYPTPSAPSTNNNAQIAFYLDSNQNFTAIAAADVPAGVYVVRDLNLIAGLVVNLHGPTTFYVTGTFNMAASINLLGVNNTDPTNLNVIMVGGGSVNFLANLLVPLAMNLYAPQTPVNIAVGVDQYTGSIIAKSLNIALPVLGSFVEVKPTQSTAYTALVQ